VKVFSCWDIGSRTAAPTDSEGKQAIGHEDAQPHHDSEVNSANMSDCELSGDLKGFQVIYIPDWKLNEDHRNVSC
jgi:hypothetical protein